MCPRIIAAILLLCRGFCCTSSSSVSPVSLRVSLCSTLSQSKAWSRLPAGTDRERRRGFTDPAGMKRLFKKCLYYITEWTFSNPFIAKKRAKIHQLFMSPRLVLKRRGALGFPSAISKQINAAGWAPCQYRASCPLPWLSGRSQKWTYMTHDTRSRGGKRARGKENPRFV